MPKIMFKKKICFEMTAVTKSKVPRTAFLKFHINTKELCNVLPVFAERKHLTHFLCISALICHYDDKHSIRSVKE